MPYHAYEGEVASAPCYTRLSRLVSASLVALASTCLFVPNNANAQAEIAAEVCNASGVCAPVDPLTALIIVGLKTIGEELEKGEKGFGPNGELVKAVDTVLKDLRNGGLGPNNDLVKAWETIRNDVVHGPGPNNDIVKLLAGLNIKL